MPKIPNWSLKEMQPAIPYKGQENEKMWVNDETGDVVKIANIFGISGYYNVIFIDGDSGSREVLAKDVGSKSEAEEFAREWMRDNSMKKDRDIRECRDCGHSWKGAAEACPVCDSYNTFKH